MTGVPERRLPEERKSQLSCRHRAHTSAVIKRQISTRNVQQIFWEKTNKCRLSAPQDRLFPVELNSLRGSLTPFQSPGSDESRLLKSSQPNGKGDKAMAHKGGNK